MPRQASEYQKAHRHWAVKLSLLFCISFVPVVIFSGCAAGPKPPEVVGEAQKAVTQEINKRLVQLNDSQVKTMDIESVPVSQGRIPTRLTLTGAVQAIPNQTIRIGTPVSGKIEQVNVNLEDVVSPGQTLVTLFSNDVGEAQSDLLNTLLDLEASRLQAETDLQLAKTTFERESRLYQEKISAKADLDAARTSMDKVTRQLTSTKRKREALIEVYDKRMQMMGASPGSARIVASTRQLQPRVNLKSVKSGIVTARNANPGEWVDANAEIITIADLDRVWVVAQAFEKDLPSLTIGESVSIQLDSRPNQIIQGKISAIGSEVHPDTRTLDIRIDVPNPHHWLKPNLFARVNITVGHRDGLVLPKIAVQTFGDRKVVYIQKAPDQYEQKTVHILSEDGLKGEVAVDGVSPDESVVSKGAFSIHGEWLKQNY